MEKEFPHGFESWAISHHEIVTTLTHESFPKSDAVSEEEGTGGIYDLAIELTFKFEASYITMEEGTFYDKLDEFLQSELN